jgi:TrmH family RNA methyltransferase
MPLRIVQSKQNGRLKELRRALTRPGRDGSNLAGIEGPNLIEEALLAGLRMPTVFVSDDAQNLLEGLRLPVHTEVLVLPRELLAPALATETPQPIAALIEQPSWSWPHLLGKQKDSAPLILALAGLQDPGNLGTIVRSAEAFGATGIVCLPGTVSAWNPKAVRASAGSVFRVPLIDAGIEEWVAALRRAEIPLLTTARHGAAPVDQADLAGPVALLIGNEGNGVPEAVAAHAGGAISIPCPGPVESLNASIAASILLYEAARQRGGKP